MFDYIPMWSESGKFTPQSITRKQYAKLVKQTWMISILFFLLGCILYTYPIFALDMMNIESVLVYNIAWYGCYAAGFIAVIAGLKYIFEFSEFR